MKTLHARLVGAACVVVLYLPVTLQSATQPTLDWIRSDYGLLISAVVALPEGGVAVAGQGDAPDIPRIPGDTDIFVAKLDENGRTVAYSRPRGFSNLNEVGTIASGVDSRVAVGGEFGSATLQVGDTVVANYQALPSISCAFTALYNRHLEPEGAFGWHNTFPPGTGEFWNSSRVRSLVPWKGELWIATGLFAITYPSRQQPIWNSVVFDQHGKVEALASLPLHHLWEPIGPTIKTALRTDGQERLHTMAAAQWPNDSQRWQHTYRLFELGLTEGGLESRLQWRKLSEVGFEGNLLYGVTGSPMDVRSDGVAFLASGFRGQLSIAGNQVRSQLGYGLALVKHRPDLGVEWILQLESDSGVTNSLNVATAPGGGAILSGGFGPSALSAGPFTIQSLGGTDGFLVRVNDDGQVVWALGFGGPGERELVLDGKHHRDRGLAVDKAGRIYVCGHSLATGSRFGNQPVTVATEGSFLARLSPPATAEPPRLTSAPSNLVTRSGRETTLRVEAEGTDLRYQWLRNAQVIDGATNAVLRLSLERRSDGGLFSVRVSNAAGEVTSEPASVTVQVPQRIQEVRLAEAGEVLIRFGDTTGEALPAMLTASFTLERSSDLRAWTTAPATVSMVEGLGEARLAIPEASSVSFWRVREQ